MLYRLPAYRPHSSPDPFGATLPPGEGIDFAPFGQKLPFSIGTTPYLYKRSEMGC